MYKIQFESKAAKYIKKLDSQLKEKIEIELRRIAQNPYSFPQLTGRLNEFRSHRFSFKGTEYRIAFKIYESQKLFAVLKIGTRENFYNQL